jgi:hypothetical protein
LTINVANIPIVVMTIIWSVLAVIIYIKTTEENDGDK